MAVRRIRADELAELTNPRPQDVDPEAVDAGLATALQHDEDAQLAALATDAARHGRTGRLTLRADIQLDDAQYRGKRTTRRRAFEEGDEEEEDDSPVALNGGQHTPDQGAGSSGGDDDDDDEDGDEAQEGSKGGQDDATARAQPGHAPRSHLNGWQASGRANGGMKDGSSESGEDEASEGSDGQEGSHQLKDGDGGGLPAARHGLGVGEEAELADLEASHLQQQAEEEAAVAALQDRGRRDVNKGRAVRQQQAVYAKVLELRILLQRALAGANRLPLPDATATLLAQSPPGVASLPADGGNSGSMGLAGLQARLAAFNVAACGALSQLMELHDALVSAPESLAAHGGIDNVPAAPAPTSPHASDTYWTSLSARHAALAGFRDAAVDRWHARAVLGSGGAALAGGLKALHQSVSRQVAGMMQDPARLIARSRLPHGPGHRHLGLPTPGQGDGDGSGDDDNAPPGRGGATGRPTYGTAVERDEETYDDGDFYQQLLQEFLEGGGQGAGLAVRPAKKRKLVDRRASKGRKIRYNVQDKLVNFMAAVPLEPPVFAEQLFANLFGHRNA